MRAVTRLFTLSVAVAATACSRAEDDAALSEATAMQAQVDSVMMAEEMYDESAFDTISWETPEASHERGAVVFRFSCMRCHGPVGLGDGELANNKEELQPPSFLAEDWRFAEDRVGLRKQVFTGTAQGMPHWGFYGLKYRDIDAVATYIQEVLRK